MHIREGYMPYKGHQTYYRIVNEAGKKAPLIFLHGGPGSTHNYFEVFDELAEALDRPLVMYDQIGCGNSPAEGGAELFNHTVWLDELEALIEHLKIEKYHLFGQSWGGMMCIWYELERKPKNVLSYILSSTLASAKLWREEQMRRIGYMADEVKNPLFEAEKTGDYDSEDYQKALEIFMEAYCAPKFGDDAPEYLTRKKNAGTLAYITGWGKNEFSPTGTLSGYEFEDRLNEIETPCLITSGQIDLSSPYIAKRIHDRIKGSKWELFQYSRHMPYIEETSRYFEVLKEWLVGRA